MREIKFRAKILGHIGFVYGTPFNQNFYKEFGNKWFDSMKAFDENGEIIDEYIEQETLSQFTGLYDKNGKEIYEGDILKSNNNTFRKVKWDYDSYGWNIWNDSKHFEVIGNIYENSELLNLT
jgi:uncharacterized phage protein (TIGR01671 family)